MYTQRCLHDPKYDSLKRSSSKDLYLLHLCNVPLISCEAEIYDTDDTFMKVDQNVVHSMAASDQA